jgi:hypothetical protein
LRNSEHLVWSGDKNGEKTDIFVFKQGYSAGARTARALFHGTADVFSLGLWEVVSTPTEAYFSGSDVKVEVVYDSNDLVKASRNLTATAVGADPEPSTTEPQAQSAQPEATAQPNSRETVIPASASQ